ncbi:hypothetical protein [Dyadobacter sp. 32]|uniref:hypothetical protein n=1 Tax=Dyadobacter sp. 32 TaxID=538966 RepID=UPI0011EC3261
MNLHSNFRYPFFKYLLEEFSGVFHESDFTSLNRLLILYHNHFSFSVNPNNVTDFLDSYERGYSDREQFYWWFGKSKRHRIRQVKYRTAFILRHNRAIFERLLSRKDYASPEATYEALVQISDWVHNLGSKEETDSLIDLDSWKGELASLQHAITPVGVLKNVTRSQMTGHFYEHFAGTDVSTKRDKFSRLKDILVEHQWIVPVDASDTYRYFKQSKGGRLYIAALYYALLEKGHIEKTLDAPHVATLFNSWLVHDFEQSSFVKAFQAEELAQFNCTEKHVRYKYIEEARLLILNL